MKHKLLIAVDGEPNSLKIIDYVARACAGSNDTESAIVIFHVLPIFPAYYYISGTVTPGQELLDWFDDQTRRAGTATLAKTKEALVKQGGVHSDRVTTELALERGRTAPQILEAAARHGCDTIVVGRHGGSMVAGFFMGSVVEHLLRNPAGIAIWIIE